MGPFPAVMNETSSDLLAELVRAGAIDAAAAERIGARREASRPRIAHILRERGVLSPSQLLRLVQEQQRSPDVRLGELAVRCGMCTQAQVDEALAEQREREAHVLELVEPEDVRDRERFAEVLAKRLISLERSPDDQG
jgi:hypothetical protein